MLLLIILYLTMIITTGCWNNRDVSDISFAVAVGLDKTHDDKIELTIQLVKPSAMKSSQNGGGKEEKSLLVII